MLLSFVPKIHELHQNVTFVNNPQEFRRKANGSCFLRLQIDSLWLATATVVVASTGHKESPEGVIALERESDSCELLGEIAST